ncbi:MAG: biopolymer transporter ExbD [SAR324 cluster bacterium]|nr:biopolymer transporter ExbD [SAR324 cluster bacterium]
MSIADKFKDDYLADINVTPFVDVLLVLVVILLVTLPLVIQTVPLDLPQTSLKQDTIIKKPAYIALNIKGQYFLNGESFELEEIINRLNVLRDADKLEMVVIQSDQANTYGKVIDLISTLKNENFEKVGLSVTEKKR